MPSFFNDCTIVWQDVQQSQFRISNKKKKVDNGKCKDTSSVEEKKRE